MEGTDVCFAPVLTMAEAPAHPHNEARGDVRRGGRRDAARAGAAIFAHPGRHSGTAGPAGREHRGNPGRLGHFGPAKLINAIQTRFNRDGVLLIPGSGRFSSLARTGTRFSSHLRGEAEAPAAGSAAGAIAFHATCISAPACCACSAPLRKRARHGQQSLSGRQVRARGHDLRRHDGDVAAASASAASPRT